MERVERVDGCCECGTGGGGIIDGGEESRSRSRTPITLPVVLPLLPTIGCDCDGGCM